MKIAITMHHMRGITVAHDKMASLPENGIAWIGGWKG